MLLTGRAKLAGVVGWPIEHSRSPCLHSWWLECYGIDGAYVPLAVQSTYFAEVIRALGRAGFQGVNVTAPHKEAALTIVDEASLFARRVGAVNTIVYGRDCRLFGLNTDGFGFVENLRDHWPDWCADTGPAVVLGAGGAARAVVAVLVESSVPQLLLVNRSRQRAEVLASDIGGPVKVVDWSSRAEALDGAALLVNTTTLGMTGTSQLELDLKALPRTALVTDIVYTPPVTPLITAAMARGNPTADGVGMLLHQARPGFTAWFGVEPEVTAELRALVLEQLAPTNR